jgi:flavin reductase (DIM6/NTAB) family NADH-FMN oxidoreductase RutF
MFATATTSVAADEFAGAMSMLASGVVLVTCCRAERPWGMTVTAFASVSAHPPTVLVSLGSGTTCALAIPETGAFGVSILSRDQVDVAEYGAVPGAAKFLDALVERCDRRSTSPAIANALVHLDCVVFDAVDAGDHTVFFGHVRAVRGLRGGNPLVYHGRGYGSFVAPEPTAERNLRCLSS